MIIAHLLVPFLLTGFPSGLSMDSQSDVQSGKITEIYTEPLQGYQMNKDSYDIASASLTVKPLKQSTQYLFHIPCKAPLSEGIFLAHLVFRKPNQSTFDTTLYATFGKKAILGGYIPFKLAGTGSVIENTTTNKFSAGAKVSILPNYLVLEVSKKQLEDRELVFAEVFGTDNPPKPEPNAGTPWNCLPSKQFFVKDLGPGNFFFGSIPVMPAPKK